MTDDERFMREALRVADSEGTDPSLSPIGCVIVLNGSVLAARRNRVAEHHDATAHAEIEAIRGVQTAKGTLDVLMEAGWIKVAGRREGPGRPTIYATTPEFLAHFGLASRRDLPGIEELRAAGLLDPVEAVFAGQMDDGPDDETDSASELDESA